MWSVSRRSLLIVVTAAATGGVFARAAQAETAPPVRIALRGYDPVSYFTPGRPEPGSAEFSLPFDDAAYWFASEEHRKMFAADPERYAPQYKGYCALSVARGLKVEVDPEAWTIWNGRLFVFGSKDSVPEFNANPGENAEKSDAAWATIKVN